MSIIIDENEERGCGKRKLYKLYACGHGITHFCDRLPVAITDCPVCGETIRFSRGIQKINFLKLFGPHVLEEGEGYCNCPIVCTLCHPVEGESNFLMWVGKQYYTPQSFTQEARNMGASKAIPYIPKGLIPGKSWIFCAMQGIIDEETGYVPGKKARTVKRDGIFYVYKVQRLDYLITENDAVDDKFIRELQEKGINPVVVRDCDLESRGDRSPKYLKKGRGRKLDDFFKGDVEDEKN